MGVLRGTAQAYNNGWQLFKRPVLTASADSDPAANSHLRTHHDQFLLDDGTNGYGDEDIINVGDFGKIMLVGLGQGADATDFTLDLYGIPEGGLLQRIAELTMVLGTLISQAQGHANGPGFHASEDADPTIRQELGHNRAWTFTDAVTEVSDTLSIVSVFTEAAAFGGAIVDLTDTGLKYLLPLITGFTTATEGAVIFRPLTRRNGVIHTP